MADEGQELLEALRAHLDLDAPPEGLAEAWQGAPSGAKRALLDRLALEALLVDTLRRAGADRAPSQARAEGQPRRRLSVAWKAAAAAVLIVAAGLAILLARAPARYPEPTATGDFAVWTAPGQRAAGRSLVRGDRIVAGPGGAALRLGGYCQLALRPGAAIVLRGSPWQELVELTEGRLRCQVAPDEGKFKVLVPGGSVEVVGTEFETTVAYPVPKGGHAMRRSGKSALVTVMVLSGVVAYHFGDLTGVLRGGASRLFAAEAAEAAEAEPARIVAGKPTLYPRNHPAWAERGRIIGILRHCPGCKIEVLDAKGNVATSASVGPQARSYELEWLAPGTYTLRVSANDYEPLVLEGLAVKAKADLRVDLEFTGGGEERRIEAGAPRRLPRDHPAWAEKGRIVGRLRDCPGCKVEALDAKGRVVLSSSVARGAGAYELGMLSPGTYMLRIAAEGYETLTVPSLEVRARSDLRVDLEF